MKFLKGLIGTLIALTIGLVISSFFLPQTAHVERSVTINSDINTVFNQLNSFKNFSQWSPWHDKDPNAIYDYSGPDLGVGNKMTWASNDSSVGKGSQEIIESVYLKHIKSELFFDGDPNPGYATFTLKEVASEQIKVTWSFDVDFGSSIIGKYFGLLMDTMLGPDYEKGLKKLKSVIENQ